MTDTEAAVLERRVPSLRLSGEDMGPRAHIGGCQDKSGGSRSEGEVGVSWGKEQASQTNLVSSETFQ